MRRPFLIGQVDQQMQKGWTQHADLIDNASRQRAAPVGQSDRRETGRGANGQGCDVDR